MRSARRSRRTGRGAPARRLSRRLHQTWQETVERSLDAAARIFHEQGYAGATTNDIADEAEVSVGSLYQYFPNQDALLVALTKRHIESATTGLADLLSGLSSEAGSTSSCAVSSTSSSSSTSSTSYISSSCTARPAQTRSPPNSSERGHN